jgi:hypothetical protein
MEKLPKENNSNLAAAVSIQEAGETHVLKRGIEARTLCIALRAALLTRYASRYNSSFKLGFRPRKDSFNSYFFPPASCLLPSASCLLCKNLFVNGLITAILS